jgi:hypothetical protein
VHLELRPAVLAYNVNNEMTVAVNLSAANREALFFDYI